MGRIGFDHMAGHEPVEQHANRGQVLVNGWGREFVLQVVDEGRDMERLDLNMDWLEQLSGNAIRTSTPSSVVSGVARSRQQLF
jgi:hypothetical protein